MCDNIIAMKNIKRASIYTITGKLISKTIGLIRERLAKTLFGLSPEMSIFSFVITVILLIRSVTVRSFARASVPYIMEHENDNINVSLNGVSLIALLNTIIGLLLIIFSTPLAKYTLGNLINSPSSLNFGKNMYILGGILLITLAIADSWETILSGKRIFTYQALREPLVNIIYLTLLFLVPTTTTLMSGRLIGEITFATVVTIGGFIYYKKRTQLQTVISTSHIKEIFLLGLPVMLGTSINFINTFADRYMATFLPDTRSVSALGAATTLAILPYGLFGEAINKTVYTGFSEAASKGNNKLFMEYVGKVLYLGGLIIIPASVGLAVLSVNITHFLYYGGRFDMSDVYLVAYALFFYAIRYLFTSLYIPLSNSFIAMKKNHIPLYLSVLFIPLNIGLNWLFGFYMNMGAPGFALATAITATGMFLTVIYILLRELKTPIPSRYLIGFGRVWIASGVMATGIYFFKAHLPLSRINTLIIIFIGMVSYGLMLLILKDDETLKMANKFIGRIRI